MTAWKVLGISVVLAVSLGLLLGCPDDGEDNGEPLTNVDGRSYDAKLTVKSITGGTDCELTAGDMIIEGTISFEQVGDAITVRDEDNMVIATGTIMGTTINISGTFETTIFEGTADEEDIELTIHSSTLMATESGIEGTLEVTGESLEANASCTGVLEATGDAV